MDGQCSGLTLEREIALDMRTTSLVERDRPAIVRGVADEAALAVKHGGGVEESDGTADDGCVSSEFTT